MADLPPGGLLDSLRQWLGAPPVPPLPDEQLLELFVVRRDEEAFGTLLQRHGPMVLGVCRRLLADNHDAEDVFQATFLVLARRAAAIRKREALGSWLYGVACHLADKARSRATRRQALEQRVLPMQTQDPSADAAWRELRPILDDELRKLPNKYRAPLVLCYLEGRTNEEAAQELRLPSGTVKSRLARARALLRDKLARRGLALSLGMVGSTLTENAIAQVPPSLAKMTLHASVTGSAAAPVALLVEGMVRSMFLAKLRLAAGACLAIALVTLGMGWALHGPGACAAPPAPPVSSPPGVPQALAEEQPEPAKEAAAAGDKDPSPNEVIFPRRMLAIVPVNYFFANSIRFPKAERTPVQVLASLLHISRDQIAFLSDRAAEPKPPIKTVVELNLVRFIDSCREEDRVVILFVGHAVTLAGKNYLVPADGELGDGDTLIPLDWLYDRLKWCKARQKVLIMDVCRTDPVRGNQLGTDNKMSESLDDKLENPPAGVQVLTACTAGQHSLEFEGEIPGGEAKSGIMLDQLDIILQKKTMNPAGQRPEDSMPIPALAVTLRARTQAVARNFLKADQTVRLSGEETPSKLVFDPKQRPTRFQVQLPPEWGEGMATRPDLNALFREVASLPALRSTDKSTLLDLLDSLPPYPKKALEGYKEDERTSVLRDKVFEAIKVLSENKPPVQEQFLANFDVKNAQQAGAFREAVAQIQRNTGLIQFKLDTLLEELENVQDKRAKETKRWQANYDFIRARLAARIAYIYEYNVALGQLRKDFPAIDAEIHKGWQLAAQAGIKDNDAAKYARRSQRLLDQMVRDNAGTPWETIARRERVTALGTQWAPLLK